MGFVQSEAMLRGWTRLQVAMAVGAVLAFGGTARVTAQTTTAGSSAATKKQPAKGKPTSATKSKGKSSASKSKSAASGTGTKKGSAKSKRHVVSKPTARSIKLTSAFHASE